MKIVGVALWVVGVVITVCWAYGIRTYMRNGQGVSQQTVNQTMLFALSLLTVPIFSLSPFHLLWMFPVGFILGGLSLAFPFSVLSVPGRFFGVICSVGSARKGSVDKELVNGTVDRLSGEKQFLLLELVELTSIDIFTNSVAQVRAIIRQNVMPTLGSDADDLNKEAWDIILELMAFSLHLADRIAFNAVGPEKRSRFMDALVGSVSSNLVQSLLTDTSSEARQRFERRFLALYEERSVLYAPLQLPSGGEAPLKGTLFWEAAKGVANAHFPSDTASATLILSISFGQCVGGVDDLSARLAGVRDL
jgi:hypothetical protein